jgi:hypothetical protein
MCTDRQITSEGYAFRPSISSDAKKLYYLVRIFGARSWISGGLWVADLESGTHERLLPDFRMLHYSISADGQRIVFVAPDGKGRSPVWIAALNGRTAPRLLGAIDGTFAYFGAPGEIVLGRQKYAGNDETPSIYHIKEDGSDLRKIIPTPFLLPFAVSPDGRWIPVMDPAWTALMVYPAGGGTPTRICDGCSPPQGTDPMPAPLSWSPDARFAYLKFATSTYAIPLPPGQMLPPIPPSGFPSKEALAAFQGAQLLSEDGDNVYPCPNPSVYAFVKKTTQRNIYRVPVR